MLTHLNEPFRLVGRRSQSGIRPAYPAESNKPSFKEAPQAQLRLVDGQFELRPLQPRASPVGIASAIVVDSALRCGDLVSGAL